MFFFFFSSFNFRETHRTRGVGWGCWEGWTDSCKRAFFSIRCFLYLQRISYNRMQQTVGSQTARTSMLRSGSCGWVIQLVSCASRPTSLPHVLLGNLSKYILKKAFFLKVCTIGTKRHFFNIAKIEQKKSVCQCSGTLLTAFGLCKMSALNLAKITFGVIQVAYFELNKCICSFWELASKWSKNWSVGTTDTLVT